MGSSTITTTIITYELLQRLSWKKHLPKFKQGSGLGLRLSSGQTGQTGGAQRRQRRGGKKLFSASTVVLLRLPLKEQKVEGKWVRVPHLWLLLSTAVCLLKSLLAVESFSFFKHSHTHNLSLTHTHSTPSDPSHRSLPPEDPVSC